jgi:predicted pyridoxine 5'-phosphate oxidase superfamily flavin-nucleotide-binding protein
MPHKFGSLVFTSAVKALQERYGSRRQYARMEAEGTPADVLGPDEKQFLAERDGFYMATLGATGWPYVQYRGGPVGFLKVVDDHTIAFADFRGNKQYISAGNLTTDNRTALIMVDYPTQTRLKILGRVEILEGAPAREWIEKFRSRDYPAVIERVLVMRIEAFDWNCQQHITPRYTEEQIQESFRPVEERIQSLEKENEALRLRLAEAGIGAEAS